MSVCPCLFSNPFDFTHLYIPVRYLGKVQATIKDKQSVVNVYYYMLMGNENSSFYLDKTSGDLYANKTLDREVLDAYNLYILCSIKPELHVSDAERAAFSIKTLDSDNAVAKVQVIVLDENDNPPVFEKKVLRQPAIWLPVSPRR